MIQLQQNIFDFLAQLKQNNDRDWMEANKKEYKDNEKILKQFYKEVEGGLNTFDKIEKLKVFRINRDLRFTNDKTPYNVHRSASYARAGAHRRGGYYLRLEPGGKSRVGGGFFNPGPADLLRIRKEFEIDPEPIRKILIEPKFKKAFGGFNDRDQVKTAPRGFNIDDPAIDLLRNKNFFVMHPFSDSEVLKPDFSQKVVSNYRLLTPFFDYMSGVLTTDLNGESLI